MPLFTGKRTARMPQVMLDPEMLEAIKHRADRMERKLGEEIVHLLMEGLYRDKEISVHECLLLDLHRFAEPRKVTHDNMRKEQSS